MTSQIIVDLLIPRLRENLETTVKEVRGLVKQQYSIVEVSYNKI
jgi:hypothetical protein